MQFGERVCPTIEAFKVWSQNLGHSRAITTLTSYGTVAPHRQAELIRSIGLAGPAASVDPAMVAQIMAAMQQMTGTALA
jgi:hypothetical protein